MPEAAARVRGVRLKFPSAVWLDDSQFRWNRNWLFGLTRFLDANRFPLRWKTH